MFFLLQNQKQEGGTGSALRGRRGVTWGRGEMAQIMYNM
jgi:hypothetical protein